MGHLSPVTTGVKLMRKWLWGIGLGIGSSRGPSCASVLAFCASATQQSVMAIAREIMAAVPPGGSDPAKARVLGESIGGPRRSHGQDVLRFRAGMWVVTSNS